MESHGAPVLNTWWPAEPHNNDNNDSMCPCPPPTPPLDTTILLHSTPPRRVLQEQEETSSSGGETWEIVYMCVVLLYMFLALLSDRVGADAVMLTALTLCMAAGIISISEGLEGFSNEGLLTVMVLFVVAEGISVTGALDWYMGKLLGAPVTTAGAQLRLMVPVSIVSAFLNNTPVVAVMIPIVQKWSKNIRVHQQQLLIPLSFASILGGTCTLIGTSTNLVVVGLLRDRYADDNNNNNMDIGLFDLGRYGVPIAVAGITYILVASPWLLPGAARRSASSGVVPLLAAGDVLLGARLTQWSPAAGRSVKRSGLRDTGGLYLVSVHRAATGNVHRAVGQEFVLNVGDVLYFTGLVEGFGDFCQEHGLEVITNEVQDDQQQERQQQQQQQQLEHETVQDEEETTSGEETARVVQFAHEEEKDEFGAEHGGVPQLVDGRGPLSTLNETECMEGEDDFEIPCEVGITVESLMKADEAERMRSINRMTDIIRGIATNTEMLDEAPLAGIQPPSRKKRQQSAGLLPSDPPKIVVTTDQHEHLVIIGINAHDRPGLLLDISKGLLRLNLQLHHTEASVVGERSLSIWRCECIGEELPDLEEMWSVMNALLESDSGVEAIKTRGLKVIRAVVTKSSRLIGKTATEVNFRETYKAAIVSVQKGGKSTVKSLSSVRFNAGDMLVLQASDDSPLLAQPPEDFYQRPTETSGSEPPSRSGSVTSLVKMVTKRFSSADLRQLDSSADNIIDLTEPAPTVSGADDVEKGFFMGNIEDNEEIVDQSLSHLPDETLEDVTDSKEEVWRDLRVAFADEGEGAIDFGGREFLTAMEIAPNSKLSNKNAAHAGISKLPGVFLVSIERPIRQTEEQEKRTRLRILPHTSDMSAASSVEETLHTAEPTFITIDPDAPLKDGDVLWFAGSASAVGDLRKIPGLKSYQSGEVEKIEDKVHDRRLVQAVVAKKGPLVGKTVKDVRFRTRYGAAVIAVHREGQRVHDHPGRIKLQGGDVLLLEAGPTFIRRSSDHDRAFALLAEVEDSAPPRLRLLIPALIIAAAMLIVFTAGVASLLVCGLVAAILMVTLGIMTEQEARDAVNWDIYITIACAFGIGTALTNSGVAGGVAQFLTDVGEAVGIGDAGLLGAVYFATFLISNVVTNNAAAALIFPIAIDAAEKTGTDVILMSYSVMLGASASFMSPFGYTTNLLIYGPGGYKYKDFLKIGTPMQIVLWILSIVVLIETERWYVCWIVSAVVFVVVATVRLTSGTVGCHFFRSNKKSRNVASNHETKENSS